MLVGALMASCSSGEGKVEDNLLEKIAGSSEGLIRGLQLGDTPQRVMELEKGEPSYADDDFLEYFYRVGPESHFQLTYTFSPSSGLYEILIDVLLEEPDKNTLLFQELSALLTKKFGAPQTDGENLSWNVVNDISNDLDITLINSSGTTGIGKIELTFYNHDN